MNPRNLRKIVVLVPTFILAILLIQKNYSSIFGIMIGVALALSSCEMIQKAVKNTFVRKSTNVAKLFLAGFLLRFAFLAALIYLAIIYFQVDVIALTISFTLVQLTYPFYLLQSMEKQKQNV